MRILLAEDDSATRALLVELLRDEGHEVVATENGQTALKIIRGGNPPGLILLDWQMPGIDGLQVVRQLEPMRVSVPMHLMVLTARDREEDVIEALDAGADDYLVKPVRPRELLARLRVGQRHLELQQDFVTAVETLQVQALQDELTGLLNRRAFLNRLESEIQRARRQKTGLALIMADIDHFKSVNDTYGHLAGDVVLTEAALRLGNAMRAFDVVGRYGGEEFAICIPLVFGTDARAVCERLRCAFRDTPFPIEGHELNLTLSLGCILVEEVPEVVDMKSLIDCADAALYAAKRGGRNCWVLRNYRHSDDTLASVEDD
jgi:two-component system cell cycle response regulator